MRNFHPLIGGQSGGPSSGQATELDNLQLMEQRVKQLESLVLEMRLELEELRSTVNPNHQKQVEKMQAYQRRLDDMFGLAG